MINITATIHHNLQFQTAGPPSPEPARSLFLDATKDNKSNDLSDAKRSKSTQKDKAAKRRRSEFEITATRAHEFTRTYSTVYLLRVTLGRRKRKKSKALPTPKQSVGAISGAFRLKDARKQPQFNTHITHVDGTNRDTTL